MSLKSTKKSELEITANLSTKNKGIDRVHYQTVDLEEGDAKTITDSVLNTFVEDGIDYKQKMIDIGIDGCATMLGHKSGVITRLKEEIPQLQNHGSCNSHNLSNTMQHAVTAFDPDMKKAFVDIYYDLGGAKGKGLKKKKAFEVVAADNGIVPEAFRRFVNTRYTFRTF